MNLLISEIWLLKRMIVRFVIALFLVFVGALLLTPGEINILGFRVPTLVFGTPALAVKLFLSAKESLIPVGIPVVALGPVASFVAPLVTAFLVALLVTFPFGLYLAIKFLYPALHTNERKMLLSFVAPALALFYSGCALAYFVIIPKTFAILYSFATPIGVAPFFALDDFISSVFFLTVSVGFIFLLPIFMAVLSRIGLIPAKFWARHWRGAVMFTVIFSAIVTPDGSGVTMALLSVPLIGLYIVGAVAAMGGDLREYK